MINSHPANYTRSLIISDLSVFDGTRQVPGIPWVFGHEGGGDIIAVGSGVKDCEVGQRVVIEPNFADGTWPGTPRPVTTARSWPSPAPASSRSGW
jgi:NADPH:quinone reductase-like Zn-dependent oxidoreductase